MGMIKQQNARKAEKALKEILNKADNDCNGKVELKDFIDILEENGIEVSRIIMLSNLHHVANISHWIPLNNDIVTTNISYLIHLLFCLVSELLTWVIL